MKVLHVNTHINLGGIGNYIFSLCRALQAIGVECVVASGGGDLESELKKQGTRHVKLDIRTKFEFSPKVFKSARVLKDIIKKERIDLVHAHTRVSQVASLLASRSTAVPYISTCHGYYKTRLSRRLFDTWGLKVVAISDAVKKHLENDFGLDKERVELIYNGVDIGRFSKKYPREDIARVKKNIGFSEDSLLIGTMGRLSPVKGQQFLIEAMKRITAAHKNTGCVVVGSGPEERALKDLVRSFGLEDRVKFTGNIYEEAPLYLSSMDIFILPSLKEGLGLSLLEAMASGRPCVASNVGGIKDIVNDGVNGLLVPVRNAGAISSAVTKLLDNGAFKDRLAYNGRRTVEEKYSIDLMAKKMLTLYRGIINV